VRQRIYFRLGQVALDRDRDLIGVISALTDEGALLRRRTGTVPSPHIEWWFVEYADLRPVRDGRRYL
jgi:hypothetical protein